MDPTLLDPGLPIAEFMQRCQQRIDHIERTMRQMHEERDGLMRMLSAYTNLQGSEPNPVRMQSMRERPSVIPDTSIQRHFFREMSSVVPTLERSRNDQILDQVEFILKSGRRKTSELVRMVERAGVAWTSANPSSLLSTLMSRDDRFVANRVFGWGLKGTHAEDLDEE